MNQGVPSRTALRVAIRRAAHQLFDPDPVLTDPLAIRIIGPELEASLRTDGEEQRSPVTRGLRTFFSIRSRVAEDALALAVARGVLQYVVLGAGLDTFAYRNPYGQLRVFEVDFPATQEWKREVLEQAGIPCPSNLTFAAIDFEHQTLEDGMETFGLHRNEPAFFSCLGVIPYLTEDAVMRTLSFTGSFPYESGIVFDYAIPREHMVPVERAGFDAMAARVAAAGEPFRFFETPEGLAQRIANAGYTQSEDLDAAALNSRYLECRADDLRLRGRAGHIFTAWKRHAHS